MPKKPHQFATTAELIAVLQERGRVLMATHLAPQGDLATLIDQSVLGNTFRGFHNLSPRPSVIFRAWAKLRITREVIANLGAIDNQADFDVFHEKFVMDLGQYWQSECGRPLDFGPGRKLMNLLLKAVSRWPQLTEQNREKLLRFLHVPLDKYCLLAIRRCIATGEFGPKVAIPTQPTMIFVSNQELYTTIQNFIRAVTAKAGVPPISLDLIAWNSPHAV